MGCDGGTIPRRDELVKTKKRPEQRDKTADLAAKWKYCAISQEELKKPVVGCELGRLYSKEAVIQYLLNKDKKEVSQCEAARHIKSLKDVVVLQLTESSARGSRGHSSQDVKGDSYIDTQAAQWECPVLGIEMNGRFKFSFLRSCGHVFSDKALKQLKDSPCHVCGSAYCEGDVIPIHPEEEAVVERLRERLAGRVEREREERRARKAGKRRATDTAEKGAASVAKRSTQAASTSNGCEEGRSGQKSSTAIQSDPHNSAVFKSLFTSSETAQKQGKAHWVTYNPFYTR